MDIVTRLKMFLDQTGISNSQFADTCEIPRPTLSQLLNGRNKKVSDEVIGKIHRAYPSLNVMWLMFGDGEMLLSGSSDQPSTGDMMARDSASADDHLDEMGQRAISFDDDERTDYRQASRPVQRVATPSAMTETIQSIMRSTAAGRMPQRGSSADRRVVKMLVFYSDGRFEEFGPTSP